MRRRAALSLTALSIAAPRVSAFAAAQKPLPIHRLAAGWRSPGALGETPDRMGIIELDWERQQLRVISDIPAPDRVHGLVAMPDGGFVAVASRPGHWLIRFDAQGRVMARLIRGQELPQRTFNGHVVLSHDGKWLFTTESSSGAGMSWVSVRDIRNLHRVNQLPSAGFDAHHVVLDDEGRLLIANGGIRYAEEGRKTEFDSMRPSLALVDPETCEVITQWRLKDQRLSIRHLAWSQQQDGKRILGVGLQAKHDDPVRQRHAPTLAVLRGNELILPTPDAQATGYVGDIAPGPNGGFVLSGQTSARGLWWQPGAARSMAKVAELTEACALAPTTVDGTQAAIIGSAKGIALWSPTHPLRVLPWPKPMLPDNHMVLLRNA